MDCNELPTCPLCLRSVSVSSSNIITYHNPPHMEVLHLLYRLNSPAWYMFPSGVFSNQDHIQLLSSDGNSYHPPTKSPQTQNGQLTVLPALPPPATTRQLRGGGDHGGPRPDPSYFNVGTWQTHVNTLNSQ
jgi:hypothetical protein